MILRQDQLELTDLVKTELQKGKSVLMQSPTGTGKTVMGGNIIEYLKANGKTFIILAHTISLVEQLAIGLNCYDKCFTYQTYLSQIKKDNINANSVDYIVIDESHHTATDGYNAIFNYHNEAKRIGLSATPKREDGKKLATEFYYIETKETHKCYGLGEALYDIAIVGYSVIWHIQQGNLAPYTAYGFPFDKSQLKKSKGEFTASSCELAVNEKEFYKGLKKAGELKAKKIIAFCASIKHAESFVEYAKDKVSCPLLLCTSKDSKLAVENLARFKTLDKAILVTCNMLNEGIDVPDADCGLFLRPTLADYITLQQAGRLLRYSFSKIAVLIDCVSNFAVHGLPCAPRIWHIEEKKEKGEGLGVALACDYCFCLFHYSTIESQLKITKEDNGTIKRKWTCTICKYTENQLKDIKPNTKELKQLKAMLPTYFYKQVKDKHGVSRYFFEDGSYYVVGSAKIGFLVKDEPVETFASKYLKGEGNFINKQNQTLNAIARLHELKSARQDIGGPKIGWFKSITNITKDKLQVSFDNGVHFYPLFDKQNNNYIVIFNHNKPGHVRSR